MLLAILIAVPLIGGLAALGMGWKSARWMALAALAVDAVWLAATAPGLATGPPGPWLAELDVAWIPPLGARCHLGMDGLSAVLVATTLLLGIAAVLVSWNEVTRRGGFFYFNLLFCLAGIVGVFLSLDLLLFYAFWELMLVPVYLLIRIWGHAGRLRAALKFFVFTQTASLLMLVAILSLVFLHAVQSGTLSFDYEALFATELSRPTALWVMLGFFIAFAVKLPTVPLHTWLPDAYTEAPTAGSVILAGPLLMTAAYGLIRFTLPLFPEASARIAPVAMALGVAGILYGALLAFSQRDMKRLVAYTSISHTGFVLLGLYAFDPTAARGVVLQVVCHGLGTGGLFVIAGLVAARLGTRDLGEMGGLWASLPRAGAATLVLALAALGLPGLGNFVAEFSILAGAYRASIVLTALAVLGTVLAAVYALALVQRAFHGSPGEHARPLVDLGTRELSVAGALIALLVGLGFYPKPVFDLLHFPEARAGAETAVERTPTERRLDAREARVLGLGRTSRRAP